MARHTICIYGDRALGSTAPEKEPLDLPPQFRHRSVERFAPWIDDNGPLWIQPIEVKTYGFPHAPPYAIAHHGLADSAWNSEADARAIAPRLADAERRKERSGMTAALVVDSSEIMGTQQANTFRKTSDGELPLGADGELLAPACATPRKHGTAILRLHTRAEAMRLRAMTVIRLKSAFRHFGSII